MKAATVERFWAKVDTADPSGCWPWLGAKMGHGYGKFWTGERLLGAHRVSWMIGRGPVPDGLYVLHRCDNPPCVRPDHLFLGTQRDNARDMRAKGRGVNPWQNGTLTKSLICLRGHRRSLETPRRRSCVACHREDERSRRARVAATR